MKKVVASMLLFLLPSAMPVAAQAVYYEEPRAEAVGYLADSVKGTSSLFWMDGRLWTCNDHGALRLFALDTGTAAVDTTLDLGVRVNDLEEVAQDSLFLYFGDFGNNKGRRQDLRILRLAKSLFHQGIYSFDTICFAYPDHSSISARNYDCEAFVAGADSLYLFTKQWLSRGSVCYALPKEPGSYVARRRFSLLTRGLVTGACYIPSRRILILLGYSLTVKPFVYIIDQFEGDDFLHGRHRRIPLDNPIGSQTEGIATRDGIHCFITNETLRVRSLIRHAALLTLTLDGLPEEPNAW
jgi:hypothetical protein